MLKMLVMLFLVTFSFIYIPLNAKEPISLTINIISRNLYNEAGKEVDVSILKKELEKLGHHVNLFDYLKDTHITLADINIFLAQFKSNLFSNAKLNWFIPNAEFCSAPLQDLQKFDLILCKTEECLRIFHPICKETYYLGFTSLDCHLPSVFKNFSKFFHLAGKSVMKGTEEVLKVWRNHPDLPKLVLIKRNANITSIPKNVTLLNKRLPRKSLLEMQNKCGIHVCPSKTEGFGHYIMEAMSAEAVVITADAPPMNEFIKDKRCLVKCSHTAPQNYATIYRVDEEDLVHTVKALQQLSYKELQSIGQQNRGEYLRRKGEFKQNFKRLMNKVAHDLYE